MNCEKCNSDNTQRLQMAYESGAQNINTTSHTSGIGVGSGGFGIGGGSTTTSGTAHSLLASRAAPPPKKSYLFPVFFGFLAWLLWATSTRFSLWFFISSAVLVLCAWLVFSAFTFNMNVRPGLFAEWQKKWICLKCGHIYRVE